MALLEQKGDPARQQTAAGIPSILEMDTTFQFSAREFETLRALANRVAAIAARPEMTQKAALWTAHNDLKTQTPMVFIDPENGWNEIIPSQELRCVDPLARVWEMVLRKQIYWAEQMKDDKVIEPFFDVPCVYGDTGWGVSLKKLGGGEGEAYIVKQAIEDYEDDFDKIRYPELVVDWEKSERVLALAHALFDGILTVRRKTVWWWTLGMTWEFINLRGLEDFMCDMLLEPEWVHRLMNLLCEGTLARLDFLEKAGLLSLNNQGSYVASGGFGFTDDLPKARACVGTKDMWGFVESQETSSVAPDMYASFIFPYHKKIAERFGLNCYGCCEPFDPRWQYVKTLPRLRKVSVSPWAKWESVPELLGKNYVASVKPKPTPLAMAHLDEEEVRRDCRRAAEATKGGICEFIMKDNHTLGHTPRNATRWVEIMREEIDRVYGG